ncbi:MAG TPA: hypothetical protein VHW93_07560 [Acidimicrobiales bacterium]|nr:hypothetical protein [Acidimicrobiales bacterium]
MPKPDPEGLDGERSGRRPRFGLNLAAQGADASPMTIIDETAHRADWEEAGDAESEMARLQAKVAFLAMQKDYWWQRSAEHAEALRAAETENLRLRETLDELRARRIIRTLS